MVEGPRIAVTGANGFLGSALVRGLVARGMKVHRLAGLGPAGSPSPCGLPVMHGEIDDARAVQEITRGAEVVVHLAGPAAVAPSFEAPAEYARVHVVGTATVLEACRRNRCKRLVLASSAEVYGAPEGHRVTEDTRPDPRSPYGVAKLAAEQLVAACAPAYGLEAAILRFFSLYGPRHHDESVLGTILKQLATQDDVILRDLRPVRDWCFVDDAVAAIVKGATCPLGAPARVYNVGSGVGTSVEDLAHLVLRITRRSGKVRAADTSDRPSSAAVLRLVADCARIEREWGWRPSVSLEAGLRRMVGAGSPVNAGI